MGRRQRGKMLFGESMHALELSSACHQLPAAMLLFYYRERRGEDGGSRFLAGARAYRQVEREREEKRSEEKKVQ